MLYVAERFAVVAACTAEWKFNPAVILSTYAFVAACEADVGPLESVKYPLIVTSFGNPIVTDPVFALTSTSLEVPDTDVTPVL